MSLCKNIIDLLDHNDEEGYISYPAIHVNDNSDLGLDVF